MKRLILTVILLGASVFAQNAPSNPEEHLPSNIRRVTYFGERAVFSPDGMRIAFVSKTFGDAFEYNVKSHAIRLLTGGFHHDGFLRVHYLANGDYLLIGPEKYKNPRASRDEEAEFWVLRQDLKSPPVRLNQRVFEGVATSRTSNRIAWSNTHGQYPDSIPAGISELYTAEVSYEGGMPHLVNQQKVLDNRAMQDCTIEAQDFLPGDRAMTFTCYLPRGKASVMTIDLENGKVTDQSQSPEDYQECEGIFPSGKYTCVECDRQNHKGSGYVDIWRLRLDGTGKDMSRLTHWTDSPGYKSSNPVVSPDGNWMAFQSARNNEPAGVGHGIFLMKL